MVLYYFIINRSQRVSMLKVVTPFGEYVSYDCLREDKERLSL
jgi:hypothetical protein